MKPHELPETPVDGYVLRWWNVDSDAWGLPVIVSRRAVYHVNRAWKDLYPDSDMDGADFTDEWQLFRNGHFTGRSDTGWARVQRWDVREDFATEVEAQVEAFSRLARKAEQLSELAQMVQKRLQDLRTP